MRTGMMSGSHPFAFCGGSSAEQPISLNRASPHVCRRGQSLSLVFGPVCPSGDSTHRRVARNS